MTKILTIVGARPQFIKVAPVSVALREVGLDEYLVHTGQHYDDEMSEIFFRELSIEKPHVNLDVRSGSHGAQTAAMLEKIEGEIVRQCPDVVLLYGDTNSTLAGALAASKLCVPIAHVEAGLRSWNNKMPEEINRRLTDAVSTLLFTPTSCAKRNLIAEGVSEEKIHNTGDVMLDSMKMFKEIAAKSSSILRRLGLKRQGYVLATVHRAENTDSADRLWQIFGGLKSTAESVRVVVPLHPRTRSRLALYGLHNFGKIEIVDPVGFLDMLELEASAAVIVTDSGGVQKEAFFNHVPCVTVRDQTEWVESIGLGWNRLVVGDELGLLADIVLSSIGSVGGSEQPYGDGTAAKKIAALLKGF